MWAKVMNAKEYKEMLKKTWKIQVDSKSNFLFDIIHITKLNMNKYIFLKELFFFRFFLSQKNYKYQFILIFKMHYVFIKLMN